MGYLIFELEEAIKREVRDILELASDADIPLERPDQKRGDFALPCFAYASRLKRAPEDIAKELEEKIELDDGDVKREGAFLNFTLNADLLVEETLKRCLGDGKDFGTLDSKDKKIIVEHTSANPNGPLHVGRARNPIIGDTLARIYSRAGYDVETQYYVDDIGRQSAILNWGLMNLDKEELPEPEREKTDHELVRYYQETSRMLEEDLDEEEIRGLIHRVEEGGEEVLSRFRKTSDRVLDGITDSLNRLNIPIDSFKSESSLIEDGSVDRAIERIRALDSCGDEEGALYFEDGEKKTFITRSDGTNLYTSRDLAYHIWKAERADVLLDILGEDHKDHGRFIQKALRSLDVKPIPDIVFHSFVSFEGEKMSTRQGVLVSLDEFMDTAREKAREEILKRRDDLEESEISKIAEKVGMGAVRFNTIKVQPQKQIDFRWEEALNFQGDSAPFVQYSHARACGILDKGGEEDLQMEYIDMDKIDEEGERELIRTMAELPWEVRRTAEDNAPHRMAKYALELAAEFNQFYRDHPVLESKEKRRERLALVSVYRDVIAAVLEMLGIDAPSRM